ncbi:hypothetical protein [Streptomyces sp. cmx-10-25]|uniref:hypothetical protein n=1 Tax=Streptomyces sp. cmx-10-25 TaxID=2790919 RepID=UPI00397F0AB6
MSIQALRAGARNMAARAARGAGIVRDYGRRVVRVGVTRVVQMWKRTLFLARGRVNAMDIWLQDHHIGVTIGALVLILTIAGLLLKYRLEEVIELARQFAPVLTILSITVGAVLSTLKWFRKRRAARLAARAVVVIPLQTRPLGVEETEPVR